MTMALAFFKDHTYLLTKAGYSVIVSVFGAVLLVLFFGSFLNIFDILRFVPWIIALNTAMAGYSLMDKTRHRLKHKHIAAAAVGLVTASITYLILGVVFFFLIGDTVFDSWNLITYSAIGMLCSELGALLAIRYLGLKTNG